MQSTEWRPIFGFEGYYEVSDGGEVRSVDRVIKKTDGTTQRFAGAVRRPHDNSRGYLQVGLYKDGQETKRKVHQLVLESFVGFRPTPKHEVRHLDGNRKNNRLSNLAWGTRSENMQDAVNAGTHFARFRGVSHCIHGHELAGDNLYIHRGSRHCKECRKIRQRR